MMVETITRQEFAERLRDLAIERLQHLLPREEKLRAICGNDRQLEYKLRWFSECVRDNRQAYKATTKWLIKMGVLNESKSNQEAMELFGRAIN